MMAGEALSPRQVALAIGVSEATVKRWCDRGLIETQRTAGGHRRILSASVMSYLRDHGQTSTRPELLGLPSAKGKAVRALEEGEVLLREALEAGDAERVRRLLFDFHLAGHEVHELGDRVIAPAFRALGERWQHRQLEIYQERHACEIVLRWIHELRGRLRAPGSYAPLAIGGTPERDLYEIPNALVEVTLREQGWRAESLGCGMPLTTLAAAARRERPKLVWLSVSTLGRPKDFLAQYPSFYRSCSEAGAAVVIGGRAWTAELRRQVLFDGHAETLAHLVAFARTIRRGG